MKVKLNGNDFFQVSSQFGAVEPSIRNYPHTGIDLVMNNGTPLLNDNNLYDNFFQKEGIITKLSNTNSSEVGFVDGAKSFGEFMHRWNETGSFWMAVYGKPFFEVMTEFFKQLGHDILVFILGNGDVFFLLPAIAFMFATFFIGRNKFTKYIVPLWFAFFVSKVFYYLLIN